MTYKVLFNRKRSAFVNDLFTHTELAIRCISTSDIYEDIVNHLLLAQPDAFLCFYDAGSMELINHIEMLRDDGRFDALKIIIIADSLSLEHFKKAAPKLKVGFIAMPVSFKQLEQHITEYCTESRSITSGEHERALREQAAIERTKHEIAVNAEQAEQAEQAAAAAAAAAAEEEAAAAAAALKKNILIVDDDRNVLKMLKAALSESYEITPIVSGPMALKFLETKTPDLILLDYEMPLMTGAQVFGRIKHRPSCADVPVLFLTSVSDPYKIREVMALKPQGYLLKPIDIITLVDAIEKYIGT